MLSHDAGLLNFRTLKHSDGRFDQWNIGRFKWQTTGCLLVLVASAEGVTTHGHANDDNMFLFRMWQCFKQTAEHSGEKDWVITLDVFAKQLPLMILTFASHSHVIDVTGEDKDSKLGFGNFLQNKNCRVKVKRLWKGNRLITVVGFSKRLPKWQLRPSTGDGGRGKMIFPQK